MNDSAQAESGSLWRRLQALDVRVYSAVAGTTTPRFDESIRRLSTAANYSRLSLASAAVLAVVGGTRGRRAAVTGLASVVVTSATVNIGAKLMTRRPRPDRAGLGVVALRHVPMPTSTSFPSGHSAAAFSFAEGVRHQWPAASVPLFVLASVVAYSRVHTGVHYPGDVLVGVSIGVALSEVTTRLLPAVPSVMRRGSRRG